MDGDWFVLIVQNKFKAMSSSDLQDYLATHPIPAVAGADGYHVTDHHHLCAALKEAYTSSAVSYHHVLINVTHDFTSLDSEELLRELINTQLVSTLGSLPAFIHAGGHTSGQHRGPIVGCLAHRG